jgi:hypothetical protein
MRFARSDRHWDTPYRPRAHIDRAPAGADLGVLALLHARPIDRAGALVDVPGGDALVHWLREHAAPFRRLCGLCCALGPDDDVHTVGIAQRGEHLDGIAGDTTLVRVQTLGLTATDLAAEDVRVSIGAKVSILPRIAGSKSGSGRGMLHQTEVRGGAAMNIGRRHAGIMVLALVAVALGAVACGDATDKFTGAIADVEELRLHEGLPHQRFERELLASERRSKAVRELDGYSFYEEPLSLSREEAAQLTGLLSDRKTFEPFSGEKLCGGFHPDYAIEWQNGSSSYRALLCFGCYEAKLFGPAIEVRHDLSTLAGHDLKALLAKHHKNRPPSRFFPR